MFKAMRKDGKGEVRGWLNVTIDKRCFIVEKCYVDGDKYEQPIVHYWENEVICSTLSMQTGQTDKHGEMIYGSFELDGTMTEGGDELRILYTDWISKDANDPRSLEQYKKDISAYGVVEMNRLEWGLKREDKKYGGFNYSSLFCGRHGEIEIIKGE